MKKDINDMLQTEGIESVRSHYDKVKKFNSGAQQQRFKLKRFDQITLQTNLDYLVKEIFPLVGLAVVWGPPKCGKSFWLFDLLMHVALGWHYRDRRTQQGTIVYLSPEGGQGFSKRIVAWRNRHLPEHHDHVPFYLVDVPLDLINDHGALILAIRAQTDGHIPIAIGIDTLNRSLVGDENSPADMSKYIRAADAIREAFGCLVVVIHHCGIEGTRPRGHTSLTAACDVQIAVERDAAENVVATVEFMKDGGAGAKLVSRLEEVVVGLNDVGDDITSCIVTTSDPAVGSKPRRKLAHYPRVALDALEELIEDAGQPAPASNHIPPNVKVGHLRTWQKAFEKQHPGTSPDTKRKAFERAATELQKAHFIGIWDDNVWLVGHVGHART